MPTRYPIEYRLDTERLTMGVRWVTLNVENIGEQDLTGLDVRLNSLDSYAINVYGSGTYVPLLKPGEEQTLPFQVAVDATGGVYVTMDGWAGGEPFHWESADIPIVARTEIARLVSFFALTKPPVRLGEPIECEATVRGLTETGELVLEFWVDPPRRRVRISVVG